MRTFAILAAVSAFLHALTLALPALANPMNSWEHTCFKGEESPGQICTTELRALYEGEEFVFYFARGPNGPVPLVALGGELPFTAMTVAVDDQEPVTADSCATGSCHFKAKKSKVLLRQFRKGKFAKIMILGEAAAPLFDGTITLLGFNAAYQRYR